MLASTEKDKAFIKKFDRISEENIIEDLDAKNNTE